MKREQIKYISKYILIMLMTDLVKYATPSLVKSSNAGEGLLSFHILIIPLFNYIALRISVFRPLNEDENISKKEIMRNFITITTSFNLVYFYMTGYNTTTIFVLVASNIIEFILMNSKREKERNTIDKNIKEYFESQKDK